MEKLYLPKFAGEDFAVWRCQLEAYLAVSDLLEIVDGTKQRPIEPAAQVQLWDKNDRKAKLIILSTLETNVVRQVMNLKSSREVWARLSILYELRDKTSIQLLLQQFFDYRMQEGMTIGQHISKIEEMAHKLDDLGQKQSEEAIVTKTLHSLPSSYMHVMSAWDSLPEERQTMENLLPRLLKVEALANSMDELSINDNMKAALYHKDSNIQGSKSKSKFNKHDTKKTVKFKGKCYYCGIIGHRKSDCRQFQADQKKERHKESGSTMATDGSILVAKAGYDENLKETWFADTGAFHHMSPRREYFRDFLEISGDTFPIIVGNKQVVYARGRGKIVAEFDINGQLQRKTLIDVLYVPELGRNLFGIGSTTDHGATAIFSKSVMTLKMYNKIVATGWRSGNGLYRVRMRALVSDEVYIANSNVVSIDVWHERLGHTNFKTLEEIIKNESVTGIELIEQNFKVNNSICKSCIFGKMTRQSFKESINRAKSAGELIHYDICGPMSVDALDNSRVMALFVDDYSGIVWTFPMRHKSQIIDKIQELITLTRASGHQIKRFRSDNAKEFKSEAMKKLCRQNNIIHEYSTPYCPEQNGRVERQNRTIVEMARSMLAAADLPKSLWGEAVRTAAHIRNRIPLERLNGKTPFEAWCGRKPDISHLRIFGSQTYMHIDKSQRQKFDDKAREVVLVGYEHLQKAYRVWERGTRRVHISRDVVIAEKQLSTITRQVIPIESEMPKLKLTDDDIEEELQLEENNDIPRVNRSRSVGVREDCIRTRQMTNDFIGNRTRSKSEAPAIIAIGEALMVKGIPETVEQAMNSTDAEKWKAAMMDEMESLEKNSTWKLVDLPPHQKAISNKWIFQIKLKTDGTVDRYKARLVVKGCFQKFGVDYEETFAPVTRYESVRILLSIATAKNYEIHQFDIKTAFLHGDIDRVIYMHQPKGFDDGSGRVCQLFKSLYGLKQTPRQWHNKFDESLRMLGLTPTECDPCIYSNKDSTLLLALHVDDGLIIGETNDEIQKLIKELERRFEMTHSEAKNYLGIEIERNIREKTLRIHQSAYICNILSRFGFDKSNPMTTPADANVILHRNEDENGNPKNPAQVLFRELIGSLMYLAVATRPDIAFIVSNLSQFLSNPSLEHWMAAKRVLRYLQGTIGLGIVFDGNSKDLNILNAYSDADFATCLDTRKSVSGVVLILNGGPMIWSARKQSIVSTSTTEAEYVAAFEAAKEVVWTRQILKIIGVPQMKPTTLYCDNEAAERLVTHPIFRRRTKHIEIGFHYVQQTQQNGNIDIKHISTKGQLADIFTKALVREKFITNRNELGLRFGIKGSLSSGSVVTRT